MVYLVLALLVLIAFSAYFCVFMMRIVSLFTGRKAVCRVVGIVSGLAVIVGGTAYFGFVMPVALFYIICFSAIFQILMFAFSKIKIPRVIDKVYRSGIIPVLLTVAILVSGMSCMKDIKRTGYTISTDKVTTPVRIVFMSDIHLGTAMDTKGFYKLAERVAGEKPDAVIIGGDWFDDKTTTGDMFTAAAIMSNISTKYGVYYVYGNHDMDTGAFVPFEDFGVTVLEDESVMLDEIMLIGRADSSSEYLGKTRKPIKKLVGDNDKRFIINADHKPEELSKSAECGVDLQVSGHTHSGQIFPFGILSELLGINEMRYGIRKNGSFTAITSSGAGGWGVPIRTEGNSEYVCIDIIPT